MSPPGSTSYRIGQLAKLSGFSPLVLRAWERRYRLLEPERTDTGQRLYTTRDLSVLTRVRELLDEGFRIGDIARMGRDRLAREVTVTRVAQRVVSNEDDTGGLESAWAILDALPCAVIVTDRRGLTRWVNRGVPALCGYDLGDLRGRSPGSVLQGAKTDRRAVERLRAAIASYRPCSVQILNYHRSGEPYLALVDIAPLGLGADPVGFVGVARRMDPRPKRSPLAAE